MTGDRKAGIEIDGFTFASKKEADRYRELRFREHEGGIKRLCLRPKFKVVPRVKKLPARYFIPAFMYRESGVTVVEDVRIPLTSRNPVHTLKRQLFLEKYGQRFEFRET